MGYFIPRKKISIPWEKKLYKSSAGKVLIIQQRDKVDIFTLAFSTGLIYLTSPKNIHLYQSYNTGNFFSCKFRTHSKHEFSSIFAETCLTRFIFNDTTKTSLFFCVFVSTLLWQAKNTSVASITGKYVTTQIFFVFLHQYIKVEEK